jgi:DNA (cytosine-5)-methyltransferase 1
MNWVRETRLKNGISQYKLAELIGVTNQELSAWEKNKVEIPPEIQEKVEKFFFTFNENPEEHAHLFKKRIQPRNYSLASSAKKTSKNRRVFDIEEAEKNTYKVISLFAGIGGMSLGFKKAGFDVVGHVEIEKSARKIYQNNFQDSVELGTDISQLSQKDIEMWKEKFGHVNVLVGGPPCQGFSLAGKRDIYDPRNQLFQDFARAASIIKPDFVMLENVRLLLSMQNPDGGYIKDDLVEAFRKVGYEMEYRVVNAADYGIPQSRERVIFLGRRIDAESLSYPTPTHGADNLKPIATLRDAISDLEDLESGESSATDELHVASRHPDHVIRMLEVVPEGMSAHENVDPKLRPSSGYNTTYKRLRWDEPSSTISTNFSMVSGSRNVHPKNTRALTTREAMRCQTFPDSFKVTGTLGEIRKGIGNAVPPMLAKIFALEIKRALDKTKGAYRNNLPLD